MFAFVVEVAIRRYGEHGQKAFFLLFVHLGVMETHHQSEIDQDIDGYQQQDAQCSLEAHVNLLSNSGDGPPKDARRLVPKTEGKDP